MISTEKGINIIQNLHLITKKHIFLSKICPYQKKAVILRGKDVCDSIMLMMSKTTKKIKLASPIDCTACAACVSVCPQKCISMVEDREGFLQPKIDTSKCIHCHRCEKTCPIINQEPIADDFETKAYAVINKDEEIRAQSSSGGVFFPLAKWVIEQGGVVFGARWNEKWEVVHDYAEDIEGVKRFMRSKYVQSVVGDTLRQAKKFLEEGRYVLYSGTPCQLGGLRAYLGKEYDKLIQVDLICHGVPSPMVWRKYLSWVKKINKSEKIVDVNFRDKKNGWLQFQQVITFNNVIVREEQLENVYFRGFLKDVYLRHSCYRCQYKTIHRSSDITLADAWGIQYFSPENYDDKGVSMLIVHSPLGEKILYDSIGIVFEKISLAASLRYNPSLVRSVICPRRRCAFFTAFAMKVYSLALHYIDKDVLLIRILRKVRKRIGDVKIIQLNNKLRTL